MTHLDALGTCLRDKNKYTSDMHLFKMLGNSLEEIGGSGNPRIPQNGWFTMENLIDVDDLGVPLLWETAAPVPHQAPARLSGQG